MCGTGELFGTNSPMMLLRNTVFPVTALHGHTVLPATLTGDHRARPKDRPRTGTKTSAGEWPLLIDTRLNPPRTAVIPSKWVNAVGRLLLT